MWSRNRGPNNIIAKNCSLWKNIYIALRIFVGSNQLIVLQMWKNSGIGIGILVSSNQLIAIFLLT
jgi:predicted branched-subunit amino acid permease